MPPNNSFDVRLQIEGIRISKGFRAFQKREEVARIVINELRSGGSFFQTDRGGFYFKKTPPATLYPLGYDSLALSAFIAQKFGLNRAEKREYEHLLSALQHEAYLRGRPVEIHQLAHFDPRRSLLYVSRFDGQMYRLDGRTSELVANGTDGVFFWDDPRWEPYSLRPATGGSNLIETLLLRAPNLALRDGLCVEDQRWLLKVWMLAQFFGSLHPTKPLLLVCGPKGGGKTSALRKWLRLLFGSKAEVTALEQSKPDGFAAKVSSAPIAIFDNVDEHIRWIPDHLAQLATGMSFSRRQLYTTNDQVEYRPDCWVGLTSRTASFVERRDDLPDRMIVLQTERIKWYRSEGALLDELASKRDDLWTELLQALNRLVAFFRERGCRTHNVRFRMADFASFALKIADFEGVRDKAVEIFKRLEHRQAELSLEKEPIYLCLSEWLREPANEGREMSSTELWPELEATAVSRALDWPYPSPHSLGQRLSNILNNLKAYFDISARRDSSNQWRYKFNPKAESLNVAESPEQELQAA